MIQQKSIAYRDSRVSYLRFGKGPRVAICFHGYGEGADSFAFLDEYAWELYTFYSIDLPFHGQTQWNQALDFTPNDLQSIIKLILLENPSSSGNNQQLTLLGYSLGGRMALRLYQSMTEEIDKLVLFAPDGLKVNFWYWFSTQTRVGNRLFALTMKYPGWFFGFLKLLNSMKLVNASIFKFVNYYIGDEKVRDLLYQRWITLRKIKPDLNLIKASINLHRTKVKLLYGMHDRIILSSVGEKFRKGVEENTDLYLLHAGHKVLHEKHIGEILPVLES